MTTLLYSHPMCLNHDMGDWHPEAPARLRAIMTALETEEFTFLHRHEAPLGTLRQIERVHAPFYVEAIFENVPNRGHVHLDPDTAMNPSSGEAALRAVGGICSAIDAVADGNARNAFCAVRPPGHHAEASAAMGFCLFNNVAIGAEHARKVHGMERVAIIDFDVHHGNGSQNHVYRYRDMESETGVFNNIVNVPLKPGSGSEDFRRGYVERILPALRNFHPDIMLISAGFDAHARDPLAQIRLQTADFAWVTQELLEVAERCCRGRVVSTLEGGYDLQALADSTAAHVRTLMGH